MTNLIFFENPLLLIIPFAAMIISIVSAILPKIHILPWFCAIVHGIFIAVLIYFNAGLSDIFFMLLLSLLSSSICNYITQKGGKRQ